MRGLGLTVLWGEPGLGSSIQQLGMLRGCSSPAPCPQSLCLIPMVLCQSPLSPQSPSAASCPVLDLGSDHLRQLRATSSSVSAPFSLLLSCLCAWLGATACLITRLPSRSPPFQLKAN